MAVVCTDSGKQVRLRDEPKLKLKPSGHRCGDPARRWWGLRESQPAQLLVGKTCVFAQQGCTSSAVEKHSCKRWSARAREETPADMNASEIVKHINEARSFLMARGSVASPPLISSLANQTAMQISGLEALGRNSTMPS